MVFGRRRRSARGDDATPSDVASDATAETASTAGTAGTAAGEGPEDGFVDDLDEEDRAYEDQLLLAEIEERERAVAGRPQGPWDAADAPDDGVPRLDLGGLLVPVPEGGELRVEVDATGAVTAATLLREGSSVQLTAFAAPRTEGIWDEVRDEIAASITGSGGRAEQADGPHGPELRALVPTPAPDGRGVVMSATRFAGVDGPRWFLRALYAGPAATDPALATPLEEAVRTVVVVRGGDPMAVRDPLPLRMPPEAQPAPSDADVDDDGEAADGDPLGLPERGPEITETR